MHRINLSVMVTLLLCITFGVFCVPCSEVRAANEGKSAAELMVSEKKIEKEKEKAMIKYFVDEGNRLLGAGDYDMAKGEYARALEIDPNNRGAKNGLKNVQKEIEKNRQAQSPADMSRKLLKDGQEKYRNADYKGAIDDFQNALVLDYENKDVVEWLKKTRRRMVTENTKTDIFDTDQDIDVATEEKTLQEKRAMLEVEKAYQPPPKPEKKPIEIEEILSPEEEKEQRARQELLDKLKKKMVPAISLTDADIRDVIRQLMEVTNVTIAIDEGAMAKAASNGSLKITFSTANEMPLLEVLNIALRSTDLGYRVEPNYIWISTPEKLAKEDLVTKTYRLKYGVRRVRKVELKEFEVKSSSSSN